MGIEAIFRYPVKAMLGERLDVVDLDAAGCVGDRRWVVVDLDTGEHIANKRGPTHPALRACRAELLTDRAPDDPLPLRVTCPDGQVVHDLEIAAALSHWLRRRVGLRSADAAHGAFAAPGRHHDFAPIHVLTTRTLAQLRALRPGSDWDPRRFRANLLLDDGHEPAFSEDDLLGRDLHAGSGLTLAVGLPTPRCVVLGRAQDGLPADRGLLRAIGRHHSFTLGPFGRHGCAGAYAEVRAPGRLRVGERLTVSPAATAAPLHATLAGVSARLGLTAS